VDAVLEVDPAVGDPVTERVVLKVAAPPASVFLTELAANESRCSNDGATIDATLFPNTVACRGSSDEFTEAVYLIDRRTASIEAVLGQPDSGEPGQRVRIEIVGDGKVLASAVLSYGQSKKVSAPTSGVLRLVLRVTMEGTSTSFDTPTGAFGDIRLLGGADDIAALKARPR
jgi:hypothetical protein